MIDRLENILAEYEDFTWLSRLVAQTQGQDISKLPRPETLRRALNARDFKTTMEVCHSLFDAGDSYKSPFHVASDLADWCAHSQRVYHISAHLSELLRATRLPDFVLGSVKFVASAFVVSLEKAVTSASGRVHDFIICTYSDDPVPSLTVRSYPQGYDAYQPLSSDKKRLVEKDAGKGHPRFAEFCQKMIRQAESRFVVGYSVYSLGGQDSIIDMVSRSAPADEKDDWELIYKLALGTNLYLQSARSGDVEKVSEVRIPKSDKRQPVPIVNGAKLFELAISSPSASYGHSDRNEQPSYSIGPHFREGYWRRPSGYGHDPEAEYTMWFRPTWVRKDKIAAGEKPIGSFRSVEED